MLCLKALTSGRNSPRSRTCPAFVWPRQASLNNAGPTLTPPARGSARRGPAAASGDARDRRTRPCGRRCPGDDRRSPPRPAGRSGGRRRARRGGSERPITWPICMPPQPISTLKVCPQWSRPASLFIRGVRPNSPIATTSVFSYSPRAIRSRPGPPMAAVQRRDEQLGALLPSCICRGEP